MAVMLRWETGARVGGVGGGQRVFYGCTTSEKLARASLFNRKLTWHGK